MTAFRDQSWGSRYASLGDQAENVFRQVFPRHYRFGLDRPDIAVSKLSLHARSAPDFGDYEALVECVGFGSDQKIKLRIEKIEGLLQWTATDPVDLFCWDSKYKRWCRGPMKEFFPVLIEHGEFGVFSDGNKHIALRAKYSPFSWVNFDPTVKSEVKSVAS